VVRSSGRAAAPPLRASWWSLRGLKCGCEPSVFLTSTWRRAENHPNKHSGFPPIFLCCARMCVSDLSNSDLTPIGCDPICESRFETNQVCKGTWMCASMVFWSGLVRIRIFKSFESEQESPVWFENSIWFQLDSTRICKPIWWSLRVCVFEFSSNISIRIWSELVQASAKWLNDGSCSRIVESFFYFSKGGNGLLSLCAASPIGLGTGQW